MVWSGGTSLVLLSLLGLVQSDVTSSDCTPTESVFDQGFSFKLLDGNTLNLEDHRGKVLIIMNIATY
jgi:hypothetical protein